MKQTFISLMRYPGGENEEGTFDPKNAEVDAEDLQPDITDESTEKGFIDKVKDALQDWSNDDQEDQDIDDTTP